MEKCNKCVDFVIDIFKTQVGSNVAKTKSTEEFFIDIVNGRKCLVEKECTPLKIMRMRVAQHEAMDKDLGVPHDPPCSS